ncbi:MAG: PAS domain S-box protein, partial [Betaproteobacteria bacterium]
MKAPTPLLGRQLHAAIAAVAFLLIGALWLVTVYLVDTDLADETRAAYKANANLARAFEEHTVRTLRSIDQIVHFLELQAERPGSKLDTTEFERVNSILKGRGVITNFGMVNEHGNMVWASENFKPINVADRDHFKVHIENDGHLLDIGKPVISRFTGKSTIIVSRRITRPDGSFGGIVYASVDPAYFSTFYRQVDLGSKGVAVVVGRDGIVRARQSGSNEVVGQDLAQTPLMRQASEHEAGNFTTRGAFDGVPRFFSYQSVRGYPLIVGVGTARGEVLTGHFVRKNNYYSAAALASLAIVTSAALAMALIRRRRREAHSREHADLELRESEARCASIVESAMDAIVTVDDRHRIVIFNRAAERLFGCSATEVVGQFLDRFIPERMRKTHRGHIEAFGRSGASTRNLGALNPISALRSNGEEFPIEASISQDTRNGQRLYTVIIRDISE